MKTFKNVISILGLILFLMAVAIFATLLIMAIKNDISIAAQWKNWMQSLSFVKKSTTNIKPIIFGGV